MYYVDSYEDLRQNQFKAHYRKYQPIVDINKGLSKINREMMAQKLRNINPMIKIRVREKK